MPEKRESSPPQLAYSPYLRIRLNSKVFIVTRRVSEGELSCSLAYALVVTHISLGWYANSS
jgi:hypothetical protein